MWTHYFFNYCLSHSLFSPFSGAQIHISFSFCPSCLLIFPYVPSQNFLIIISNFIYYLILGMLVLLSIRCTHSSMVVCSFMSFIVFIANLTLSNYHLFVCWGLFSDTFLLGREYLKRQWNMSPSHNPATTVPSLQARN